MRGPAASPWLVLLVSCALCPPVGAEDALVSLPGSRDADDAPPAEAGEDGEVSTESVADEGQDDLSPASEEGAVEPAPVEPKRDLSLEARALELAGFRGLGVLMLTSSPSGAEVLVDGEPACFTPCRKSLPPGSYSLTFRHRERDEEVGRTEITSGEQIQVHAVLGQNKPWKLIVPTYFVGAIFTLGGISALVVHRDIDPQPLGGGGLPADERRFHRNLGVASLALGLPVLVLATYLLLTGKSGEVRTSVAPGQEEISLEPFANPVSGLGGLRVVGRF